MASTGVNDGAITRLSVDGVIITHLINCSVTYQHDPREVTTKDSASGAKEFLGGLTGWSVSGEAYFDETAAYGFSDLFTLAANKTSCAVIFGGHVGQDYYVSGTGYVSNVTRTAGNQGENESFTVEIQGTGTASYINT